MSSETQLSTSHSGFWNALLPMGEAYIRAQNSNLTQFGHKLPSFTLPDQRGTVNEAAFLIFQEAMKSSKRPFRLGRTVIASLLARASNYTARLRNAEPAAQATVAELSEHEAKVIAEVLFNFFTAEDPDTIVKPPLPGCGWMNAAEADILCGRTLYEVKAGERHFRVSDLRQLLCYCALNFSAKKYDIQEVALINPRAGTLIREDLDSLCLRVSGTTSASVLSEIVSFISEPLFPYQAP